MAKGTQPVSLRFLAEQLGLSQGTVSMALSPGALTSGVAAKTRERVLKAAAELNYQPNHHARSLSMGRSYTVGVIMPAISEGYYATLIAGIEERLLDSGYFFFFTSHHWNEELVERFPQELIRRGCEGLILINTTTSASYSVPYVKIGPGEGNGRYTNVCLDEERGTRLALEHLVALGHRNIAFFQGDSESASTEARWSGIQKAAKALKIEIRPQLTVRLELGDKRPSAQDGGIGYRAALELLERQHPFTALLAFNDSSALGAMRAFQFSGRRVPEDISVVGYDDIPSSANERPALTTVHQPIQRIGSISADILLKAINGEVQERTILIEPHMVVRASTTQPPDALPKRKKRTLMDRVQSHDRTGL